MTKFAEITKKYAEIIKNTLYLLGIVAAIFAGTVAVINRTLDAKLDSYFNDSVVARFVAIETRLDDSEEYIIAQVAKNLEKQYEKVAKDPADIKRADIEDCIKFWGIIKNPTDFQRIMYDTVLDYYKDNY